MWCNIHGENHHGKARKNACKLALRENKSFAWALDKASILGRRKKRMRWEK